MTAVAEGAVRIPNNQKFPKITVYEFVPIAKKLQAEQRGAEIWKLPRVQFFIKTSGLRKRWLLNTELKKVGIFSKEFEDGILLEVINSFKNKGAMNGPSSKFVDELLSSQNTANRIQELLWDRNSYESINSDFDVDFLRKLQKVINLSSPFSRT